MKTPKAEKPQPPGDETVPEVAPRDFVAIKPWVFGQVRMTPIQLVRIGWPNKFQVMDTVIHNGQPALRLDPCCNWMVKEKEGKVEYTCTHHPAKYFEKLPAERKDHKDDRYFSLDIPWGQVVSAQYLEDEKTPAITLKFGGGRLPFSLVGEMARYLRDRAKEIGLFSD